MEPDLFLGIDPGPFGARHGWAVFRHVRGLTPRWLDAGHGTADQILALLRGGAAEAFVCVAIETPAGYVWSFERGASLLNNG